MATCRTCPRRTRWRRRCGPSSTATTLVRTVAATPLVLMRRLHRDSGCERVLVGTLHDGEFLVEEAFPSSQLLGARLRIPPQLIGAPVMLDTRAVRLPLDWTLACAGRPSYLVASPVGDSGRTLVMAGHGEVPLHQPVANIAEQMAHLLAGGHTLQRDRSESRHLRALVDHLPSPVLFVDSRSFEVLLNDPARAQDRRRSAQPVGNQRRLAPARHIVGGRLFDVVLGR